MSVKEATAIAGSEVVFAILFILFLVWYLKKSSTEAAVQRAADIERTTAQREADRERDTYMMSLHKEREETLQRMLTENRNDTLAREGILAEHLQKMVEQQERIGDTLKEVSGGLIELEKKVDNNVMEIWKTMAAAAPKGRVNGE